MTNANGNGSDGKPAKVLGREAVVLPRRFYTTVATSASERGFIVLLDGRPIRTPAKSQLIVPTQALADALAAEWQAQQQTIDPATMPITRIVNTTIDAVTPNLPAVHDDLIAFAANDALCYRASEPAILAERQRAAWDPVLAWAAATLGARFKVTDAIVHIEQPAEAIKAVSAAVGVLSPWKAAPIHVMTTLTGSAILALAVANNAIPAEAAWSAAHVDEDFQIERWGEDSEAAIRRTNRHKEMVAASVMLETLR